MSKREEGLYFRVHRLEVKTSEGLNAMLERRLSLEQSKADPRASPTQ